MNSLYNENLARFASRFPELARLADAVPDGEVHCSGLEVVPSRSGAPTLRENGVCLHSLYDPVREAERLVSDTRFAGSETAVFAGLGLAYAPTACAHLYPGKTIVIIEPDVSRFFLAFSTIDLSDLLAHGPLILLPGVPVQTALFVLERLGLNGCYIYRNPAITATSTGYYDALETLVSRNREKAAINEHTLDKFGKLWLRNLCANLGEIRERGGVVRYEGKARGLNAFILAAGPSLDEALPFLRDIRERCVLICVDTALRACLAAGVQPDFIILADPQYWNWRHLDRLEAPRSILVTESAAWPAVFRFTCKEILLCSSLFPLGKFIEKRTGNKGELGAGGSVSTTAWDFARMAGCEKIVMAGLDLGFPGGKTHFKGSTFEERVHLFSTRLSPAETDNCRSLCGADSFPVNDYLGGTLLTDRRLSLYAWWFESKCASVPETPTLTVSPRGMMIPGIGTVSLKDVCSWPPARAEIDAFINSEADAGRDGTVTREAFDSALREAENALAGIRDVAENAVNLCQRGLRRFESGNRDISDILERLGAADRAIRSSEGNELASMVFPGPETLRERIPAEILNDDSPRGILRNSEFTYGEIAESARYHLEALKKSSMTRAI